MDNKYEIAMDILKDEMDKELDCAMATKRLLKKTLNPIKRVKMKYCYQMFMGHCIGVEMAMRRIRRELKES